MTLRIEIGHYTHFSQSSQTNLKAKADLIELMFDWGHYLAKCQ